MALDQPAKEVKNGKESEVKVPWKQFTCAGLLIVLGAVVIVLSSLILEVSDSESIHDLLIMLIVVGAIVLLCGLCYIPMTILAYRRVPGYSLENIPKFGCPDFTFC